MGENRTVYIPDNIWMEFKLFCVKNKIGLSEKVNELIKKELKNAK